MYLIGIDIGGTLVKIGLIEDGKIVARQEESTNTFDLVKQLETKIQEILNQNNLDSNEISGIGVGCPGIVINGEVVESANLNLSHCNLKSILSEKFNVPVVVKNDCEH